MTSVDGRLARIQGTLRIGDAVAVRRGIEAAREKGRELDLGVAWAALHFLMAAEIPMPKPIALERGLSWSRESFANVLMGGEATAFRASFGPARYLKRGEVQRLAARLVNVGADEVIARYDAGALDSENIPGGPWEDDLKTREWLKAAYVELSTFYASAAEAGDGLLLYMI